MNDSDTSEEESVAARDRKIAAAVIFAVAFPGAICNALVAMFARAIPTLNNPFGRLTASQATGETFLCALFAFYYVPMVFLKKDSTTQPTCARIAG
ncbi:unnamed protein product [Haemonchus placei]|uniref:7TM_GPCR_Srx domain-containing protein n=1 Tax=Haemonchus placei TaxID=6290 RepID=A0A0N4WLW5_HAEPC|nr:unnamed protein product [Haemonchus placei]